MAAPLALRFEAIGTAWVVDSYGPMATDMAARLSRAIRRRIAQFDRHYSRFRSDSLVTAMAAQAGTYQLPPDAAPLMNLYWQLYQLTSGAFTPLIGQTLADAGYDATYSLTPQPLVSPPRWEDALDYRFPRLVVHRPVLLDVGAAGKGYLVDIVSQLLEAQGVTAYCVDAGGDMRVRRPASSPLRIGLEHPADPAQAVGLVELANGSLCGSAGNRRAWGPYHHILDPHRLASPRHLQAVWVKAASTLLADALATALFLVDAAVLKSYYEFDYALIHQDGTAEQSAGFPGTFFTR